VDELHHCHDLPLLVDEREGEHRSAPIAILSVELTAERVGPVRRDRIEVVDKQRLAGYRYETGDRGSRNRDDEAFSGERDDIILQTARLEEFPRPCAALQENGAGLGLGEVARFEEDSLKQFLQRMSAALVDKLDEIEHGTGRRGAFAETLLELRWATRHGA